MSEFSSYETGKTREVIAGFLEGESVKLEDENENELEGTWEVMEWDAEQGKVKVREVGGAIEQNPREIWVKPEQLKKIDPEKPVAEQSQNDEERTQLNEWEEWQKQLESESAVLNIIEQAHINTSSLAPGEVDRLREVLFNTWNIVRNPAYSMPAVGIISDPVKFGVLLVINNMVDREELDNSYKVARHVFEEHMRHSKIDISNRAHLLNADLLRGYELQVKEHEKRQGEKVEDDLRKAA